MSTIQATAGISLAPLQREVRMVIGDSSSRLFMFLLLCFDSRSRVPCLPTSPSSRPASAFFAGSMTNYRKSSSQSKLMKTPTYNAAQMQQTHPHPLV